MSRETPPTDYEREPVPRGAYLELLKSCARLNELIRAKKTRKYRKVYFCYECGAVVEEPKSKVRILCEDCKELGKILQEATQRENWAKKNKMRRKK